MSRWDLAWQMIIWFKKMFQNLRQKICNHTWNFIEQMEENW